MLKNHQSLRRCFEFVSRLECFERDSCALDVHPSVMIVDCKVGTSAQQSKIVQVWFINCRSSRIYLWKSMKIESQQQFWEESVKYLFAGTVHDRVLVWLSKTQFWRQRKTHRRKAAGGLLRWNLATGWSNCRSRRSRRWHLKIMLRKWNSFRIWQFAILGVQKFCERKSEIGSLPADSNSL